MCIFSWLLKVYPIPMCEWITQDLKWLSVKCTHDTCDHKWDIHYIAGRINTLTDRFKTLTDPERKSLMYVKDMDSWNQFLYFL